MVNLPPEDAYDAIKSGTAEGIENAILEMVKVIFDPGERIFEALKEGVREAILQMIESSSTEQFMEAIKLGHGGIGYIAL